jgi:dTDP-4-dehydrorhamnose 3,5-epimerase
MSRRFEATNTPLAGLTVLRRAPVGDHRGFLERLFDSEELAALTGGKAIAQVNRTLTAKRGAVRGMHYQHPPHAEVKFVACLRGEVFDVAVDLRRGSPTFLRWHGETLTESDRKTLVIPQGFAHGFQTLSENCELLYFHTASYRADSEGAVNARDPKLGIRWPDAITELSSRDASHPMLTGDFSGIEL